MITGWEVGRGVADMLMGRRGALAGRVGERIRLRYVVDKRLKELAASGQWQPPTELTDDLSAPLRDPGVDIVVELFGGITAARDVIEKALNAGKDVVTANKALLAEHGEELFGRARELGRSIAFEAAVAGGVPIIAAISQCLTANRIISLRGILNGTSNFIVSQMEEHGVDYAEMVGIEDAEGRPISVWGCVSVTSTFPHGTPDDVRAAVERSFTLAGKHRGFVLSSTSSVMPEAPHENIDAFFTHGREFGREFLSG